MKPLDTASELYREIKRRGLHLRKRNGRDNALLQELIERLGCPDNSLQRFLDHSDLTAEAFLITFLKIAAPFAGMFQEIWSFLSENYAPKAEETISIRFGFQNSDNSCSLDLEQFRRIVKTSNHVFARSTSQIWPFEALHGLFDVSRKFTALRNDPIHKSHRDYGHYDPGKPYQLPSITVSSHPFDKILENVHSMFQYIIDSYALEEDERKSRQRLPELEEQNEDSEDSESLRRAAWLLTDLLPSWFPIFDRCHIIDSQSKTDALQQYNVAVKKHLLSAQTMAQVPLLKALDVLDLPFWRHRWHTYEIWASVLTLRSLQDYRPGVRIIEGHLPIDGYAPAIIADLRAKGYLSACVAVQVQTPFRKGLRKAIRPDLRICFDKPFFPNATAAVIEFKQRKKLNAKELKTMIDAYSEGSPRSGGVVVINYDSIKTKIDSAAGIHILEDVHPMNYKAIVLFKQCLADVLQKAHLEPLPKDTMVLLDVSGSMGGLYKAAAVQSILRKLLEMPWVKILRFNDGLVQNGDSYSSSSPSLKTHGGTQLSRTLREIEDQFGLPNKLLIVTDGDHEHPTEALQKIQEVKECLPLELSDNISWLH